MRQLVAFSKQIADSRNDHHEFLAKIHGAKLETNQEWEPSSSLTVDQEKKVEEHLRRLNEKLRGPGGAK